MNSGKGNAGARTGVGASFRKQEPSYGGVASNQQWYAAPPVAPGEGVTQGPAAMGSHVEHGRSITERVTQGPVPMGRPVENGRAITNEVTQGSMPMGRPVEQGRRITDRITQGPISMGRPVEQGRRITDRVTQGPVPMNQQTFRPITYARESIGGASTTNSGPFSFLGRGKVKDEARTKMPARSFQANKPLRTGTQMRNMTTKNRENPWTSGSSEETEGTDFMKQVGNFFLIR